MTDENMNEEQGIRLTIEEAEKQVKLWDALKRLEDNPDFQLVLGEEYFKQEAIRLVHLKSDPSMQEEKRQIAVDQAMLAIGRLGAYFNSIHQQGYMAQNALADVAEETEAEAAA